MIAKMIIPISSSRTVKPWVPRRALRLVIADSAKDLRRPGVGPCEIQRIRFVERIRWCDNDLDRLYLGGYRLGHRDETSVGIRAGRRSIAQGANRDGVVWKCDQTVDLMHQHAIPV